MTVVSDLEESEPQRVAPVRRIPTDPQTDSPEPGIALCMSGGGYRAMLFHAGALWRLNELGYLPRLARISSVSGGSIAAGVLGSRWARLEFDEAGVGRQFEPQFIAPIRSMASRTIDWKAVVGGLLLPGGVNKRLANAYRNHLFGQATLQDLPDQPRFVINATSLQSGVLWRFSKPYSWDYRVGKMLEPRMQLAVAVAASSAFPPFLSPAKLRFTSSDYVPDTGDGLQREPYTTRPRLTDGGVYDNLGLETAWKRCRTVLVSDGGGHLSPKPRPIRNWPFQSYRVLAIINNQVLSLR